LQRTFTLDVPMVPSLVLTVTTGGEHLSSDVFSFGETICFGSLDFIIDRFSGLRLSPIVHGLGAAVMGSTYGGTPSPLWAMIEDFVEEFHTAWDEEGWIDLPFP
jgi:hypothetical protein